jgi:hypothetical protein
MHPVVDLGATPYEKRRQRKVAFPLRRVSDTNNARLCRYL